MNPSIACLILYCIRTYLTHIVHCDAQNVQIMVSSYVARAEQVVGAPTKYFAKSWTITLRGHVTYPKYVTLLVRKTGSRYGIVYEQIKTLQTGNTHLNFSA